MKVISAIVLILAATSFIIAQNTVEKPAGQQVKLDPLESTLIPAQWESLPFDKAAIKSAPGKFVTIDGVRVETREHTLAKERLFSAEICYTPEGNKNLPLLDDGFIFGVKTFITYQVGKRVFAYEIFYDFRDSQNGMPIGAGASEFYIDSEGRGMFRIDCDLKNDKLASVPKWAKNPK